MLLHYFLLGALLIGLPSAGKSDDCQKRTYNGQQLKKHSDSDGNVDRCCVDKSCHEGFRGVMCSSEDPGSSTCEECPPDTYNPVASYSSMGFQCYQKKICDNDKGFKELDPGSNKKDRICTCDVKKGYFNRKKIINPIYCNQKFCPAGQQLTEKGKCEPCPINHIKPTNETHFCVVKTDCDKLGLGWKSYNYTSRIHDNVCYNKTANVEPNLPGSELPELTIDATTMETSQETTETASDSFSVPVVVIAVLVILIGVVMALTCYCLCRRKSCEKKHAQDPLPGLSIDVEDMAATSVQVKCPAEHDENAPLNTKPETEKVKRVPSETDERDSLMPEKSFKANHQMMMRQNTVDSGFCGNSSGSERGSAEFQMESGQNTPSTSGLKAEPPPFPCESPSGGPKSLPTSPTDGSKSYIRSNSVVCENCHKRLQSDNGGSPGSSPGSGAAAVHNYYHLYGSNSTVQICSGDAGQNVINKNQQSGPTCTACAEFQLGSAEEEDSPVIERRPFTSDTPPVCSSQQSPASPNTPPTLDGALSTPKVHSPHIVGISALYNPLHGDLSVVSDGPASCDVSIAPPGGQGAEVAMFRRNKQTDCKTIV